mmetsp:Transcript_6149/g.17459  ORF Transcript_6149/g.17459 Transcript_6149/m.17459 type:complete len:452 (+) Transcript_6149:693-2048(+)
MRCGGGPVDDALPPIAVSKDVDVDVCVDVCVAFHVLLRNDQPLVEQDPGPRHVKGGRQKAGHDRRQDRVQGIVRHREAAPDEHLVEDNLGHEVGQVRQYDHGQPPHRVPEPVPRGFVLRLQPNRQRIGGGPEAQRDDVSHQGPAQGDAGRIERGHVEHALGHVPDAVVNARRGDRYQERGGNSGPQVPVGDFLPDVGAQGPDLVREGCRAGSGVVSVGLDSGLDGREGIQQRGSSHFANRSGCGGRDEQLAVGILLHDLCFRGQKGWQPVRYLGCFNLVEGKVARIDGEAPVRAGHGDIDVRLRDNLCQIDRIESAGARNSRARSFCWERGRSGCRLGDGCGSFGWCLFLFWLRLRLRLRLRPWLLMFVLWQLLFSRPILVDGQDRFGPQRQAIRGRGQVFLDRGLGVSQSRDECRSRHRDSVPKGISPREHAVLEPLSLDGGFGCGCGCG